MAKHMPPVPPDQRSDKGPGSETKPDQDTSVHHPHPDNVSEQGETANVRQNTTNKGFFAGRRSK